MSSEYITQILLSIKKIICISQYVYTVVESLWLKYLMGAVLNFFKKKKNPFKKKILCTNNITTIIKKVINNTVLNIILNKIDLIKIHIIISRYAYRIAQCTITICHDLLKSQIKRH